MIHRPTGERWLVAYVSGDRLVCCGWPETSANLRDCQLVRRATPQSRDKLLREMAAMNNAHDSRCRYARWRLSEHEQRNQQ